MKLSTEQENACNKVILDSEKCIRALSKNDRFNPVYNRSFKQCQEICFTFLHAARNDSMYVEKLALLTIGLCEECAEICDELKKDRIFQNAAISCRACSSALSQILSGNAVVYS